MVEYVRGVREVMEENARKAAMEGQMGITDNGNGRRRRQSGLMEPIGGDGANSTDTTTLAVTEMSNSTLGSMAEQTRTTSLLLESSAAPVVVTTPLAFTQPPIVTSDPIYPMVSSEQSSAPPDGPDLTPTPTASTEENANKLTFEELLEYEDRLSSIHLTVWTLFTLNVIALLLLTPLTYMFHVDHFTNHPFIDEKWYKVVYRVTLAYRDIPKGIFRPR